MLSMRSAEGGDMNIKALVGVAAAAALLAGSGPAAAQQHGENAPPAKSPSPTAHIENAGSPGQPTGSNELPLPPSAASAQQTIEVNGRMLTYTVTAGAYPVLDGNGKRIADVDYTAYTLNGARSAERPVTFAFNGGPGSASAFLQFGAIGPKHIGFGNQGSSPSNARLVDNPSTWLDVTDLVFVDPVGTGYSRLAVDTPENRRKLFSVDGDVDYLSRFIGEWLEKNGRMASPKYLVGESYGGFRVPKIAYRLQTVEGVGVSGITIVSGFLDRGMWASPDTSPMSWVSRLPSMAATALEAHGPVTREALAPAEAYARGDYLSDLVRGRSDPAATGRVATRVAQLTGLDPRFVARVGGRIDFMTFTRELHRDQGTVVSVYDGSVTAYDPFPWSNERRGGDPVLEGIIAPVTAAAVDLTTRTVGWKVDWRYTALNEQLSPAWIWESGGGGPGGPSVEAVSDLRRAMANDPHLKVLVTHGFTDLITPYFASQMIIDQMPASIGDPSRIRLGVYPGGHMFYTRDASRAALKRDAAWLYGG